jgi:hypothetical protein
VSERLPALQWICVRSVDDARQALPVLGMLATEHCPQAMEHLRRVEGNLDKIYDAATRPAPAPTTPGTGGGKTLGDEFRAKQYIARQLYTRAPDDKTYYYNRGAEVAFIEAERMADARDRLLLALVAELRRKAEAWRYSSGAHAFYGCGIGYREAADAFEAALRGGTEAGEG